MGKLNRPIAKRMLIEEEMSLVEATSEEPAVPVEEPEEDLSESSPSLSISVTSPSSGSTIQKDAFAIEGQIVSGTASKVTVTWSGMGNPSVLGLFEPAAAVFAMWPTRTI